MAQTKQQRKVSKLINDLTVNKIPTIEIVYRNPMPSDTIILSKPAEVVVLMRKLWPKNTMYLRESFYLCLTSADGNLLGVLPAKTGDAGQNVPEAGILVGAAVLTSARGLYLVQNKIDGTLRPLARQIDEVRSICNACKSFKLFFYDYIVINEKSYYSLAEAGGL